MSIKILLLLLLYISWVFPYTTNKIKICGRPRDSGKIRSSSWSVKVCPDLAYSILHWMYKSHKWGGGGFYHEPNAFTIFHLIIHKFFYIFYVYLFTVIMIIIITTIYILYRAHKYEDTYSGENVNFRQLELSLQHYTEIVSTLCCLSHMPANLPKLTTQLQTHRLILYVIHTN
jgi:hypothetical protein